MKILITGACGFVGSCLARELPSVLPGIEIWGLDNFLRKGSRANLPFLKTLEVTVVEGDIRHRRINLARQLDESRWQSTLQRFSPQVK